MEEEAERMTKRKFNKLFEAISPLPERMSKALQQHRGRRSGAADDPQAAKPGVHPRRARYLLIFDVAAHA